MDEDNASYYIASGRSLEAIEKYQVEAKKAKSAWEKFKKKYGGETVYVSQGLNSIFRGLGFKKNPPNEDWRVEKRGHFSVPRRNTPNGKKIAKEMDSLPSTNVGSDIGTFYCSGFKWHTPGFQKIGEKWIIKHHINAAPPSDAIPLKRSEYWEMVESQKKK